MGQSLQTVHSRGKDMGTGYGRAKAARSLTGGNIRAIPGLKGVANSKWRVANGNFPYSLFATSYSPFLIFSAACAAK
jgi:hypothetical protein